jgi:hypothetical protein
LASESGAETVLTTKNAKSAKKRQFRETINDHIRARTRFKISFFAIFAIFAVNQVRFEI